MASLTSGQVIFGGTGGYKISSSLTSPLTIQWTSGASASTINLNFGTPGTTSGLTQYNAAFNVAQASQNGSSVGQLTGVSIDSDGFVVASFSNNQTQKLFQIPLATVDNPNGLLAVSGSAYVQTEASGVPNLNAVGSGGAGSLSPSALEQSNVNLSSELTNLIVAQQAYGANTKLLTVTSQLLQQLNQIIQ